MLMRTEDILVISLVAHQLRFRCGNYQKFTAFRLIICLMRRDAEKKRE